MAKKKKKFKVTEHKLVPKHEILSEEEAKRLLDEYKVESFQLPQISSRDPVVKEIGAEKGDILKITRESPTAGKTIAYRYVV
ncbi:DNA-directed RNA polymerase subunit H [candidate division MSBL1 archaeon SCGC-AAA261G05]|uniref:DNA-directed RNA polymerase subunit Rpo5 n=2 Tax=candidate division MSBL1 TaxID=215777 RepID=A0A133V196_9EURY|nr:DNA-directed RNA polymerase subunit H [candidate division MSBL1 archaeon SCGC-AAA261C02]KXB04217.1 DNA-directed RNA polymerase subunit H [candidate division MSBL1 archaeon SCGC-AAA261G05]